MNMQVNHVLNSSARNAAGRKLTVVMSGPLPPAVGGMASVLSALNESSLSKRVNLILFETGKTTPAGRPLWQGITARLRTVADWWTLMGLQPKPVAHIHTCSGFTFFLDCLLLLICRMRRVPTVMHVHGARFDAFLDDLSPPLFALARWLSRRAGVVIVLSQEWRERLTARWPDARLAVVNNGVSTAGMAAAVARGVAPRFVFLGNLGRRKGVHLLLEAASVASQTWHVDLAGGEEEPGFTAYAQAEIERLGLGNRVHLLGPVVGDSKTELLAGAQGFVLPSLAEGLPMSLLEAMAMGLPSVVSAVGAMSEVVRHGVDGSVVPPGDVQALADALDYLAQEPDQRQCLGRSAKARCESLYGIERMVDSLMNLYAEKLKVEM